MDLNLSLTRPTEVRILLNQLGHRPNKGLGQNYLIDANVIKFIINESNLASIDKILEIGPGLGSLTEEIFSKNNQLICIEKDLKMVSYLKKRFVNLDIIEEDVLNINLNDFFKLGVNKVISNLPYSVASRVIVNIVECINRPDFLLLTIQKEVADRIIAEPGCKSYGILSVLIGVFYERSLVKKISPTCFFPSPKVWSAIICLKKIETPILENDDFEKFKYLVKHCFSQRRKQLKTSLKNLGISNIQESFNNLKISSCSRPEQLDIKTWVKVFYKLKNEI